MRGPSVMKGYYDNEEETLRTLHNGWLHTGDLGRFDEEGYLYFLYRKKDVIKSAGENVSSREVEGVIARHEKVMQVAVIAANPQALNATFASLKDNPEAVARVFGG